MTDRDQARNEPDLKKRRLEGGYFPSKLAAEQHQPAHRSEGRIYKSVDSLIAKMKNLGINPKAL